MGLQRGVSNTHWWLGKRCVYPLNWVVWSVVSFNQVLLGTWLWRYGHEVTHLWQRVISTK